MLNVLLTNFRLQWMELEIGVYLIRILIVHLSPCVLGFSCSMLSGKKILMFEKNVKANIFRKCLCLITCIRWNFIFGSSPNPCVHWWNRCSASACCCKKIVKWFVTVHLLVVPARMPEPSHWSWHAEGCLLEQVNMVLECWSVGRGYNEAEGGQQEWMD